MKRRRRNVLVAILLVVVAGAGLFVIFLPDVIELLWHGDTRELRKDEPKAPRGPESDQRSRVIVVAIDGVERGLLYDLLRAGRLPNMTRLLGGMEAGRFPHAFFDDTALSILPSTTMPAWATVFSGVNPAQHGLTGNEYFIREKKQLAALAPSMFTDPRATIEMYTDDAADALLEAPTVYERLRQTEPGIRIWVSTSMFHRGADLLLMAKRQVLTDAVGAFMDEQLDKTPDVDSPYAQLDEEVIEVIVEALEDRDPPDVLTLYFAGVDLLAHDQGPDVRSAYFTKVVDPALKDLVDHLENKQALDDTFVVIVSDHGHSAVPDDDQHALDEEPRRTLEGAGFRVRPYEWKVDEKADFQAVLAGGGATAYVYLADRSSCAAEKTPCAWERPPRFAEDVIPAAEAFSTMLGIEVVLTRRPRPFVENDAPFEAYAGGGRLEPVSEWLRVNPHPSWLAVEERLGDLAAGPHGERAGDLLLLAKWPDDDPNGRYYFSRRYASWHGSPAARESSIVLILGRRGASAEALEKIVREVTGDRAEQDEIADLLLRLRRS